MEQTSINVIFFSTEWTTNWLRIGRDRMDPIDVVKRDGIARIKDQKITHHSKFPVIDQIHR